MLEDLLAGIKPAQVLMLLLDAHRKNLDPLKINALPRHEIKALCATLDKDSWEYFTCKVVQHATNYDAKPETCSANVFKESDGVVDLTKSQSLIFQTLYKTRYRPEERVNYIRRTLGQQGWLQAACGIRRKFFGIRNPRDIDDEIVRQAAAFEPQANTTYCTNLALRALWYDPDNRSSTGWLHIDPLLQIHDALAGQNHSAIRQWAHGKLQTYFNNQLTIHGINVSIPADGGWGPDWGHTNQPLLK
jgi:hypothetical protein